jgi:hypothetical protein
MTKERSRALLVHRSNNSGGAEGCSKAGKGGAGCPILPVEGQPRSHVSRPWAHPPTKGARQQTQTHEGRGSSGEKMRAARRRATGFSLHRKPQKTSGNLGKPRSGYPGT